MNYLLVVAGWSYNRTCCKRDPLYRGFGWDGEEVGAGGFESDGWEAVNSIHTEWGKQNSPANGCRESQFRKKFGYNKYFPLHLLLVLTDSIWVKINISGNKICSRFCPAWMNFRLMTANYCYSMHGHTLGFKPYVTRNRLRCAIKG